MPKPPSRDSPRPRKDAEAARLRKQAGQLAGDRADLSSQAAKVESTVAAAKEAPEIRFYLVELARQLHDEGQLGADLDRLAERLIDSVLEI
jgi:hypothetical protein